MKRKSAYMFGSAVGVLAIHGHGFASDTVTYTYDALGRLVAVSTSGGPTNGQAVSTAYDPAGNRTNHAVSLGGTPPPPPPPPPPPGNQPPVALNDTGGMSRCASALFPVLLNDSDPDGNTPLALVSVSGGGPRGTPSIQGTSIRFDPEGINGMATVSYTMRDSLGATASATLTITITNGSCGPPQ